MKIRIESLSKIDRKKEKETDTLWLREFDLANNLEDCIKSIVLYGIEHIHIQTENIDFLKDSRLKNLKGISLQFPVKDLSPLFLFPKLTHLSLCEKITQTFDFSKFKNLISIGGRIPKKNIHFEQLKNLKYAYLRAYPKNDLSELSNFPDLRTLNMYNLSIENFKGLEKLSNLEELIIERAGKLKTLEGIGRENTNLKRILIFNAKNLKDPNALTLVPNLKDIRLTKIPQLNSLKFLEKLENIEDVYIPPQSVGVIGNDYYPLVKIAKEKNLLHYYEDWRLLNKYLNNEIQIVQNEVELKNELDKIKYNLPLTNWTEKSKFGLKQYTEKNCKKGEKIIVDLIEKLNDHDKMQLKEKILLIKKCVIKLNKFNAKVGHDFIETAEREELCGIFDNIAEAVGIDVLEYDDGIASEWREW
jgi:hypothetical protein